MKKIQKHGPTKKSVPVDKEEEKVKEGYIGHLMEFDSKPQKVINMQILDFLYLGSVGSAYNFEVLKSLRITHILTVCENLPPKFPNRFVYKIINITDEPTTKIGNYFREALEFIRNAIIDSKNVLVHCFAGVSRSATIVIAYVMKYHRMNYLNAFNFVKNKRYLINPNYGFQSQLRRFSEFLNASLPSLPSLKKQKK